MQTLMPDLALEETLESARHALQTVAREVEARDPLARGHNERVARAAVKLGRAAGLSPEENQVLAQGALVHDIGKIALPDKIVLKPAALDAREWQVMRSHPMVGGDILEPFQTMGGVLALVLLHHERLDGSGYPYGLAGPEIPLPVRILSIVDVHDVLTHQRAYKPAFPPRRSADILRSEARAGWWDRELVELFLESMP